METKLVKVPFNVELAKRIQNGDVEGKIITDDGRIVRIVCFDMKSDDCIVALVQGEFEESVYTYTPDGRVFVNDKSPLDLMLKIPEYMTFKDGDILMLRNQYHFVFVYNSELGKYGSYFGITFDDCDSFFDSEITSEHDENIIEFRKANTEEKQKLIDILKKRKEPKAKEYLKQLFGIEEKQEYEFKLFDRVLVSDDEEDDWKIAEYSHKTENNQYYVVGGLYWLRCIPYNEKTAHLLGTTEDCKED